ncbi:MAG: magnesium transporter [Chloroflexi bacterium]|nr:magnesium transporter [Chloroflexota bacterium]
MERSSVKPTVDEVRTADLDRLRALSPEELTQRLDALSPVELAALFDRLGDEALAALVAELDAYDAARLLRRLSRAQAADLLEEMDPDDAADVVEELRPEEARAILTEMEPADAQDVQSLLVHPPRSAGGLMTPEYVALGPDLTAEEAIARLRQVAEEAETIYYIYVTDPATNRLLGVLSLRNLVLSRPDTPIRELMITPVVKVRVDASQEEAARLLDQYHLIALPVVDAHDRLLGIITADDAADVLLEEAGEDIERLGGSQPLEEPYMRASIPHLFRKRIGWLLVLFVAEAYTGTVLRHFEETLSQAIALAFFIPLLIGTGGNVGSQTVTTLVRALAVGEVEFRDWLRVLGRELAVAGLLGAVMGLATYVRAWTLGVGIEIGPVVAVTALCVVLWAATVAAVLPLVLHKLRIDPAVVSAPFITTLVDGTGLFLYFTIARLLLHLA